MQIYQGYIVLIFSGYLAAAGTAGAAWSNSKNLGPTGSKISKTIHASVLFNLLLNILLSAKKEGYLLPR